jgi:acetylornithine/N-succinyldiaminopimelate aminotransferase
LAKTGIPFFYPNPEVVITLLNAVEYGEISEKYLVPNYGKRKIVLARGAGSYVWDVEGRKYLDFLAGISVVNLGHCHPVVTGAIVEQAATLMHCSNIYGIPQQAELARQLCDLCFAEKAFFANSGAEVNEAALKLARLYSKTNFGDNRYEIITFTNSFHGRTLATVAATGQQKIQKGFDPLPVGFVHAEFNNLDSVRAKLSSKTCAIMVEPVQGEGGIVPANAEFLQGLREICNSNNLLLIFDEIQCGMARCGAMFAHQLYDVEPDIMTIAKALGNGFPIGAMLTRTHIAEVFQPGTHGSTFGGNPMACSAGLAVLSVMQSENIPAQAKSKGDQLRAMFQQAFQDIPVVKAIRGCGMMLGIVLTEAGAEIPAACAETGLFINCTAGNILRLLPPLTISEEEMAEGTAILKKVLEEFSRKSAAAASSDAGGIKA